MGQIFLIIFSFNLLITNILAFDFNNNQNNIYEQIKSGFKLAGQLLGFDQANGVAQLVSEAFGKAHQKKKGDPNDASNFFSGFLRILGLDSGKIGAITVNTMIFIAQMISSALLHYAPGASRKIEGTPFEWLMNNEQVKDMIANIKDHQLPNDIINYIRERATDEESDCLQLLICKISPFIWNMQKSFNYTIKGRKSLYAFLPTMEEFIKNGDDCEEQYQFCFIENL